MNQQAITSRGRIGARQLEVRLAELQNLSTQASRRSQELTELSRQARQRRAQLRTERELIRAQLILRRSSLLSDDTRAAAAILEAALHVTGLSVDDLWLDYFALGGDASRRRLQEMLSGEKVLSKADHDRLAVALNERLSQAGWGRPLAYWDGSR